MHRVFPAGQQGRLINGPSQVVERNLDIFRSRQCCEFAAASFEVWPEVIEVVGRLGFHEFPEIGEGLGGIVNRVYLGRWLGYLAVMVQSRADEVSQCGEK